MTLITDERCLGYRTPGHPERPTRVGRTTDLLKLQKVLELKWAEPGTVGDDVLLRAHPQALLDRLQVPEDFDGDTAYHPGIADHARRGVAGAIRALELARSGEGAFCLLRPPGHHATRNSAMGFCYLGSLAIAALHARATGLDRVGLFDFDVHHGNGTEDIVAGDARILMCSFFQHPLYPYSGTEPTGSNLVNVPLAPYTRGAAVREAIEREWVPALEAHQPQMYFVSAGFDAHREDELGQMGLVEADYAWITRRLVDLADRHAQGRIVSCLEGGYQLGALARSVAAHVRELAGLAA